MNDTRPEAPNVLLSVTPEFADGILAGRDAWEYRRVIPAKGPPIRWVLYASKPVQAAVGSAWTATIRSGDPKAVIDSTIQDTGKDPEHVRTYLEGCEEAHALRMVRPHRFDEPVRRDRLAEHGVAPSENFRYLGSVPAAPERSDPETVVPGLAVPEGVA